MSGDLHGRVAVVDDEENIREAVGFALRREGYEVDTHVDGLDAWNRFEHTLPDVIVLDILMPQMDGLELCRRVRSVSQDLPIIFLTSRDEEFDRVLGLELGADDYLCKPFSMRELVARVKVLFRRRMLMRTRSESPADRRLRAGSLELDLDRYTVTWNGDEVALTLTEFLILRGLVRHPGHVKTRQQLIEEGYPHDAYVSERTVDSHVKRIRRKFDAVCDDFTCVETVHGLGYRFRTRSG